MTLVAWGDRRVWTRALSGSFSVAKTGRHQDHPGEAATRVWTMARHTESSVLDRVLGAFRHPLIIQPNSPVELSVGVMRHSSVGVSCGEARFMKSTWTTKLSAW